MNVKLKSPIENISDNHWALLFGQISYSDYIKAEGFSYTSILINISNEDIDKVKGLNSQCNDNLVPLYRDVFDHTLTLGVRRNISAEDKKAVDNIVYKNKLKLIQISDYDFSETYFKFYGFHRDFPQIPTALYVKEIVNIAIKLNASDITTYVDVFNHIRVMFRVKGFWETLNLKIPITEEKALITALTNIDITAHEQNKPVKSSSPLSGNYIGRHTITFQAQNKVHSTTRISSLKTFDKTLKDLNLSQDCYDFLNQTFTNPKGGLRLVCGKPASGKNWTINACLKNYINMGNKKIQTIEYPMEFLLEGAIQQPCENVDEVACYCEALTTQSPDVAYISETRDETAKSVLAASTTGNVIISTLHTNNVADTLLRINIMTGLPYDIIVNILHSVVFQRLVYDKERDIQVPKNRWIEFTDELKLNLYGKSLKEMYEIITREEKGDEDIWNQ